MTNKEKAREYLLKDHVSPLNDIMHQADLKAEMQYHQDIENAFVKGCIWKQEQMIERAVEWIIQHRERHRFLWSDIEEFKQAMKGE